MNRSTMWVGLVAVGGVMLALGLLWTLAGSGLKPKKGDPAKTPVQVKHAALGDKYFKPDEAQQLLHDLDLEHVAYRSDVDLEDLLLACPRVDCIPSIDAPRFEDATATWMYDDGLVIGVAFNGVAKAYPIRVLTRHEIVNDVFGDTPVVISYCPLCNSATAFVAPTIKGRVAQFGVSGRLYKSDLVMYDRVTHSLWSQIEGRAIVGPLAGDSPPLQRIPVDISNWGRWKQTYPQTQLLSRPTTADAVGGRQPPLVSDPSLGKRLFDYSEDPYRWYQGNDADTYGLKVTDQRLPNKTVVIGVEVSQAAKAYERRMVKNQGVINDVVQGVPLVVVYNAATDQVMAFRRVDTGKLTLNEGTLSGRNGRWSLSGQPLEGTQEALVPLNSMPVYWFAWAALHPQTQLYAAQ